MKNLKKFNKTYTALLDILFIIFMFLDFYLIQTGKSEKIIMFLMIAILWIKDNVKERSRKKDTEI
jgi:hypothetical protein